MNYKIDDLRSRHRSCVRNHHLRLYSRAVRFMNLDIVCTGCVARLIKVCLMNAKYCFLLIFGSLISNIAFVSGTLGMTCAGCTIESLSRDLVGISKNASYFFPSAKCPYFPILEIKLYFGVTTSPFWKIQEYHHGIAQESIAFSYAI